MTKKRVAKRVVKRTTASKNLITFVRMPKGIQVTGTGPKNPQLAKLLDKSGLNPAARCFGGDTCIV